MSAIFSSSVDSISESVSPRRPLRHSIGPQCLAIGLLVAAVTASGCQEVRVPVFPVTGRVTVNGKPAAGAQVVLHSETPVKEDDVAPSGVVQPDGTFAITVYEPNDGAPEGDYNVTVQWFKMITDGGGSAAGPNVLPAKYASPKTSPVKVSVRGGPAVVPTIAIN